MTTNRTPAAGSEKMTELTYGGHTLAAIREFLQHGDDTGETIDQLTGDEASSANIIRDLLAALDAPAALPAADAPKLTVWYGSMPESNGKTNWTAILHKGNLAEGHTIDRSEYPDRVRYGADCVRYLIGELQERPWILDYDADKHSGYVAQPAADAGSEREALVDPLYILSLNEEAMEEAIERFEGSSTGEALKCVLHAQKQLRDLFVADEQARAAASAQANGQAEPAAWAVYWGIGQMRPNSVHFEKETAARVAAEIKSNTEIRPLYATPSQDGAQKDAWQPIETAPKTGRTVLLGYQNRAGNWRTVRGQWMSESYIAEYWENPDDVEPGWFETAAEADDVPNCWRIEPTHWMPLPAAPLAASAGKEA